MSLMRKWLLDSLKQSQKSSANSIPILQSSLKDITFEALRCWRLKKIRFYFIGGLVIFRDKLVMNLDFERGA